MASSEIAAAAITGRSAPHAVAPSMPAIAGPRTKPRFEETAIWPKLVAR